MNKRLEELITKEFLTSEELDEIYLMDEVDKVEYNGYIGYISTKYLSNSPVRKSYTSTRTSNSRPSYTSTSTRRTGGVRYYTNTYGNRVQSPTHYDSRPSGATALCRDGSYSFSQSRRGTCSHHGGVARWY